MSTSSSSNFHFPSIALPLAPRYNGLKGLLEGGGLAVICTLDEIRRIIVPIAQKYNLSAVYLFGSYARGTAREDSDLDLLVDTTGARIAGFFELAALHLDLEEALQKRVDLITLRSIQQKARMPSQESFQKAVLEEMVKLYENFGR